ncbi:MAG: hypothetical protein JW839_12670 [Candidatus Lokiarchaeota archaeon]|nr:hypothetical protein [Candidatus Lokiarchaeota archaeon]
MKRRILPPIQVKQTSLNKFFPGLPPVNPRKDYIALSESIDGHNIKSKYTLGIREGNVIEINERHCLECGKRLLNNGFNRRIIELDLGAGRFIFHLHRKRCPTCGEIKLDLSSIVRAGSIYHDNYARRARQHYKNGSTPIQIQRAFITDFNVKVSLSSIVRWINTAAIPLQDMLTRTPVPSSGFWAYDEIHMRIRGVKCYDLCTIDVVTGFIPGNLVSPELGRQPGKRLLAGAKRHRKLSIEMLVMDGTNVLGKLFHTRGFDNITLAQCLLHHKWQVCKKIKKLARIPERSPKPIPDKYRPLKKRFYDVFDSPDETRTYIALEILRDNVSRLGNKEITRCFKDIETSLPKIIAWQRDPRIPKTNNKMENSHQHIEYYPSFKRRMMTIGGGQRVASYRVYNRNFSLFPAYIDKVWKKRCEWKARLLEDHRDPDARSAIMYYYYEAGHLNQWYGEYSAIWEQYFAVHR